MRYSHINIVLNSSLSDGSDGSGRDGSDRGSRDGSRDGSHRGNERMHKLNYLSSLLFVLQT